MWGHLLSRAYTLPSSRRTRTVRPSTVVTLEPSRPSSSVEQTLKRALRFTSVVTAWLPSLAVVQSHGSLEVGTQPSHGLAVGREWFRKLP